MLTAFVAVSLLFGAFVTLSIFVVANGFVFGAQRLGLGFGKAGCVTGGVLGTPAELGSGGLAESLELE